MKALEFHFLINEEWVRVLTVVRTAKDEAKEAALKYIKDIVEKAAGQEVKYGIYHISAREFNRKIKTEGYIHCYQKGFEKDLDAAIRKRA